jgi:hypothetical protein
MSYLSKKIGETDQLDLGFYLVGEDPTGPGSFVIYFPRVTYKIQLYEK